MRRGVAALLLATNHMAWWFDWHTAKATRPVNEGEHRFARSDQPGRQYVRTDIQATRS